MSCNEWKEYTLQDICIEITDGSHASPKSVEDGYPMASVKDMNYFNINIDTCRRISYEDYKKLVKGNCKPLINDVLIAKDGSYMKYVNVVKKEIDLVLLSSIAILRPNIEFINPMFLKYYLLTPNVKRDLEQGYVSGSAIRRIVLKDFKRFPLNLPPLEEQEKIADILSSLDDKIQLNNEMNKTLEEMAQALFKRWFVDFEFPNENGEPYKSSGGEIVESELGMIPKGWEVKSLDEIADFLNGLAMQKFRPKEDDKDYLPVLKIKELKQGNTSNDSDRCSCNIDKKYIITDGDVIFAWSGSLDVRIWCGGEAGLNQHLFKVTSQDYPKWFYYLWVKRYLDDFIRIAADRATTMGHIKRSNLSEAKVLVPSKETIKLMGDKLGYLIDDYIEKNREVKHLVNLRNTLLPKLMSGEIRVK